MDAAYFLAKLLGLMLLICGAFILLNKDRVKPIIDNLHSQPALLMLAGMLNVLFGLLIILSHPHWTMGWQVIITILGYLILIKGLLRLFAPKQNDELTRQLIQGQGVLITGIVTLVLGVILFWAGFLS